MGAGEIFRGVAQGLLGAGKGAADYALERDAELRKQAMLKEIYGMKQAMTPLERDKIQSEIDYNRARAGKAERGGGGGGGRPGKPKTIWIQNKQTGRIRVVPVPEDPGEQIQLEPGDRVFNQSGGGFNQGENDEGFAPETPGKWIGVPDAPYVRPQPMALPPRQPVAAAPAPAAAPSPTSGPPPGATHQAPDAQGRMHYTNSRGEDLGIVR